MELVDFKHDSNVMEHRLEPQPFSSKYQDANIQSKCERKHIVIGFNIEAWLKLSSIYKKWILWIMNEDANVRNVEDPST